jgi:hypothetical protein
MRAQGQVGQIQRQSVLQISQAKEKVQQNFGSSTRILHTTSVLLRYLNHHRNFVNMYPPPITNYIAGDVRDLLPWKQQIVL